MTITDYITKDLTDCGLFPEEAAGVLEAYKASIDEDMSRRLEDDTTDYPMPLLGVVMMGVRSAAREWLLANKPKHWALGMFPE